MNWKTFTAMLARDARVARRNLMPTLLQTMMQPLLLTFVFGKVMTSSGMMQAGYKGVLLPGIIAMAMMLTGFQAVAMPLIAEFQWTREIEDRLLAPMKVEWLAVEKIVAGTLQALFSGAIVVPATWLMLGSGVGLHFDQPLLLLSIILLVGVFSAGSGLALGCSVEGPHIGLMFSLVLAPMLSFGCIYYPWSALGSFPIIQKLVLLNPLVYASEGLRGTLAPQFPHLSPWVVVPALIAIDVMLVVIGLKLFVKKAVS